eukprot:492713-Prymnesium_polylepis.3
MYIDDPLSTVSHETHSPQSAPSQSHETRLRGDSALRLSACVSGSQQRRGRSGGVRASRGGGTCAFAGKREK